ncbi:MAG TPA: hypothetical protein VKY15_04875 [Acidimicrobiales bacterium]|nr:hypothetical protein [Acidimicrobiales bacterium]
MPPEATADPTARARQGGQPPGTAEPAGRRRRRWLALGVILAVSGVAAGFVVAASRSGVGSVGGTLAGCEAHPVTAQPLPPLASRPLAADLSPAGGEPPANVLSTVQVPAAARRLRALPSPGGAGVLDQTVTYLAPVDPDQLSAFFAHQFATGPWQSECVSASRVLARLAGSDGFYWEVGVTLARPAGGGPAGSAPTRFDLRLYQVDQE